LAVCPIPFEMEIKKQGGRRRISAPHLLDALSFSPAHFSCFAD